MLRRVAGVALFAGAFCCSAAAADARPIALEWDASTDASVTGYVVYWGTEPGSYSDSKDVGNSLTWSADLPGSQYFFAVRSYDALGNLGPFSLEVGDTEGVLLMNPGSQLSAVATDVSLPLMATGSPVLYSVLNLPPGLGVNPATGWIAGTVDANADAMSPYKVTARVSDPTGNVSSVQFIWTVKRNHAPLVSEPGSQSAIAGGIVRRLIDAWDPDGDVLTFSAAGLPNGLVIDPATGTIAGTVALDAAPNYDVTVSVSDGELSTAVDFAWSVAAPGALAIDQIVSADAFGSVVSTQTFSTSVANETLIAFVTAAQPTEDGVQTASVEGGGLSWSLVARANAQAGTSEIWQATASAVLSDVTVTATVEIGGDPLSLTVVSFAGSGGVGAAAAASAPTGPPSVSLITTRPGSFVYGAGNDWDHAIPRSPAPGQAMVHEFITATADSYWVQSYGGSIQSAGTPISLIDTAPTTDRWNFAAVEILPLAPSSLPTVIATPAMAVARSTITATVAHAPGKAGDWLGLFAVQAGSSMFLARQYLHGATSAILTFTAPSAPGLYNLRLFAGDNPTTPIATSNVVLVPGSLSIDDVSVVEGDSGTVDATFTVKLTPPSPVDVTVNFTTADGSANAGSDYVARSGTLILPAGTTARTVVVRVNGDTNVESDETFFVTLSGATNAIVARSQGVGTIVNDDVAPEGLMFGAGRIDDGHTRHWFVFRVAERNNRDYARLEYWSTDDRTDDGDDDCHGDQDRDYGRSHRGVKLRFTSTATSSVAFSDDPAFTPGRGRGQPTIDSVAFAGAGVWNGKSGYTFEVRATDQGEPGRQRDTFSLVVRDNRGTIVANVGARLSSGEIESSRLSRGWFGR